jgi:RHS repeat-associated protein
MRSLGIGLKVVVAALSGLVAGTWSAAAHAQCSGECITWTSSEPGWNGTFTGDESGHLGVSGGSLNVDGANVRPVVTNSQGAQRGSQAVSSLLINPPPVADFSAVPADASSAAVALGTSLEPTVDATPGGQATTVAIAGTVPSCAMGPNPTCSGAANLPIPLATGPTVHPNLKDNLKAIPTSDPVNPANGELVAPYSDLSLPGFGVPFNHVRTYRSRLDYDGPLGFGWDHSYNQRIIPINPAQCAGGVLYAAGDGTVIRFEETPQGLIAPPGVHLALQRTDTGWTMTRPDGITSKFARLDGTGLLASIRDLNEQGLSFAWTKIEPGPVWRLTSATDSTGRTIAYAYHPDGHLKQVSSGTLAARYDYDGNELHHVVKADAAEETYEYRHGFPDDDRGDAIPAGQVAAACEQACGATPGCGAVDPCVAVVADARARCHEGCAPCNAACLAECPGIATSACQDVTGACQASCEATSCAPTKIDRICQDAFVGRGHAGDGPTPEEFCDGCVDAARSSCRFYCSGLSLCVQIADGSALSCGISVGFAAPPAAGPAAIACYVGALLGCLEQQNIALDEDTAKRIAQVRLVAPAYIVGGAVVDTGECVGTAVGSAGCSVINFFRSNTCDVDVDCDYDRTKKGISLGCEDDCFLCNAFGEHCGSGSCNAGHHCEDDCRDEFFGRASSGTCPEYAAGGGCPGRARTECHNQCRTACRQNCASQTAAACQSACQSACAPAGAATGSSCDAACDVVNVVPQCRAGCVQSCIAANSRPAGTSRYGGLRDLNHNLTRVLDATGQEVLVNTYGEDPTHPAFDSVIAQTNGDFALSFRYRDLGAEQRGLRPVPTDPQETENVLPSMSLPDFCTDVCEAVGSTLRCFKGSEQSAPRTNAERATLVTDAYGVPRAYYFDAAGELIVRHDMAVAPNAMWSFTYRGGELSGVRGPAGDRQCIKRDSSGSVVEALHFPTPGSTSDNSDSVFTATPHWFRYAYKSFPTRLMGVGDPRRAFTNVQSYDWDAKGNLISSTDGNGSRITFVPTSFGPPDTATLPNGSVTKFVYDQAAGALKSIIRDSEGPAPVAVSLTSDALGRPSVATGALGETTTWQWDGAKISSITRHANGFPDEVTSFSVDANGRVVNTDNGQLSVTTRYDRLGFAQSTTRIAKDDTNARARIACTHRGPDGRLLDEVLPGGNRVHYGYDAGGRLTSITKGYVPADPGTWDDDCPSLRSGELITLWSGTYGFDGTLDSFVDAQGATTVIVGKHGFGEQPAVIREANGRITDIEYDELGNVMWQATYACGFEQPCTSLPAYAKPTIATPNLARMAELSYDLNGVLATRDVWHFDPATGQPIGDGHARTSYVRDPINDAVIVTDDAGDSTTYRTDRAGRLSQVMLPTGDVVSTTYEDGGAIVYRSWPAPAGLLAERTRLTPWGAPAEVAMLEGEQPITSRPARPVRSWTYDVHRRHTGGTDVGGAALTTVYDAFGQPVSVTRDFGGGVREVVTQTFTANGLLDTSTSAAGFDTPDTHTALSYDLLDRLSTMTRNGASGEFSSYSYEGGSDFVRLYADPRGTQTEYVRWAGGAVRTATAIGRAGTSSQQPPWTRAFTYDGAGRMRTARVFSDVPNTDETVTFGWDSMDNKISEFNTRLGSDGRVTDRFDGAGRRAATSLGSVSLVPGVSFPAVSVSRVHDQIGRIRDLTASHTLPNIGIGKVHFDYIGLGRLRRVDLNGQTSTYNYDSLGRLAGIAMTTTGGAVGTWTWQSPLDGLPRQASYTDQAGVTKSSLYLVDAAGRLTAEANGVSGAPVTAVLPSTSTAEANSIVTPTIGEVPRRVLTLDGRGNWLNRSSTDGSSSTTTARNGLDQYSSFDGRTIAYDGGALSEVGDAAGTSFQYDSFGQLIAAGPPQDRVTYTYDALGRMTSRASGSTTDRFAYNGAERVAQSSSGGAVSFVIDGDEQDEHLLRRTSAGYDYVHQDRMGSVYLVTGATGAVRERYAYSAYGERVITSANGAVLADSAIGNDLGFQGQRHDARTGFVEMRNRWHRPDWGRFISADPIGMAGGSNFYAFAYGAPLAYSDPFGLTPVQSNYAGQWTGRFWIDQAEAYRYQTLGPDQTVLARLTGFVNWMVTGVIGSAQRATNLPGAFVGNIIDQTALRNAGEITQADRQADAAGHQIALGLLNGAAMFGGVAALAEAPGATALTSSVTSGAPKGSQSLAAELQARAAELNAVRGSWLAKNGTTAAMLARNSATGEVRTFVATESRRMDRSFVLRAGEEFVEGIGHAEETILGAIGKDWIILGGGASRNVCLFSCAWQLGKTGLGVGGPVFRGASDKTGLRLFWRE